MYCRWGVVPNTALYIITYIPLDEPAPRQTRRDLRLPISQTNLGSQKNSYKRIASLLPKSHLFCFSPILPPVRHTCVVDCFYISIFLVNFFPARFTLVPQFI
jgi:hypothetical protein